MKIKFCVLGLVLSLIIIPLLISCGEKNDSPLLKETLNPENLVDIANKIKDDKDFTPEEIDYFSNGLVHIAVNKDSLEGKTVEDVIEFEKKARYERSIKGLLVSATRSELGLSNIFRLTNFQPAEKDGKTFFVLLFKVENLTKKKIKNLKGNLNINYNNRVIKQFPIIIQNEIEAGKSLDLRSIQPRDVNNQIDQLIIEKGKEMKPSWQPVYVEFDDGEILDLSKL